jgi:2-dehydropantoate 2-reductase
MRVLIVGAGGIGGYFGGRLVEKGEDVTFLVRNNRKQQLDENGLKIESVHGNMEFKPKTLLSGEPAEPFDVILLSTKAYHLQGAIESTKPHVTEKTMILPLLNGVAHIEELRAAFGKEKVIGGLCFIETTLDEQGKVIQTSPIHDLVFGEFSGEKTERIQKLQATFQGTKASFRLSENIEQDMWHKYQFIATLSGVTSLLRSPIGPIRDQEYGIETIQTLLQEVGSVMRSVAAPLADGIEESQFEKIMQMGYNMKSSLQRDMEKGLKTEVEHFFGYLLRIAKEKHLSTPVISTIYTNLEIYEAQ